jgi:hypothetical protein
MPDNEGMSTYSFVIEQDEDGVYVASCPALPDHKNIAKGTLRAILRDTRLEIEDITA